jgi:hypothetical protein
MHGLLERHRGAVVIGCLLITVFLSANLATSSRSPVVWQDEVMFADPAANFALGNGFTTSAWFQSRDTLFAGNAPLYSMCLSLWITVFGFDVVAVRTLNYVLVLAVLGLSLLALKRKTLVRSGPPMLLFALLVLCGDGVTYSYRGGRYDCLGMVLVAGLFLALTIERPLVRAAATFLLATVVPWAGLQLLPYLALLGLILVMVRGRATVLVLCTAGAGCLLGLCSLAAFLLANGVWRDFLMSVAILSGARRTLWGRIGAGMHAPFTEPSSILLLLVLGLCLIPVLRRRDFRLRSPLAVGLVCGLLVPCLLAIAGKYARYYCWMAYIPMAACVAAEWQAGRLAGIRPLVLPLLLLACLVGLPARLAVTMAEWDRRDPAPVDRIVAETVHPPDWVYSEYEAYYPAKRAAAVLFLPPFAGLTPEMEGIHPPLSAADRNSIDLLILKPSTEARTLQYFGGRWKLVGQYSALRDARWPSGLITGRGSKPYELRLYRREREAIAAAR